jgi:uncharacterized protein (UPF0210 family)
MRLGARKVGCNVKKRPSRKTKVDAHIIAKAEKILNRTLAYQAAIAVHELKDELGLDVEALRLVVAPVSMEAPGAYRVTCIVENLHNPVILDIVVEPGKAVTANDKKAAA